MIGHLLRPEIEEMISEKQWDALREALVHFHPSDIAELLVDLPVADDVPIFRILPRELAGRVFSYLPPSHQESLLRSVTNEQMRSMVDGMTPDDQARLLEELPPEVTRRLLEILSPGELKAARDLLGYPPDTAGRFMTPKYVAVRSDMTAQQAIEHVRKTGRDKETVNVLYVLDGVGKLVEDVRLGTLVMADPARRVSEIHESDTVALRAMDDPATSSAPFVATLVDVTGLVIYFSVAFAVLRGTLL